MSIAIIILNANSLFAQMDDYVQDQLNTMTDHDPLNLDNPLDGYLKTAAENNPRLKSLFNRYLAYMERLPQAKSLPDPSVMFSYYTSPVETRVGAMRGGLSVNQAFPWFGQLKSQEQAAAAQAKASFEAFDDERNKLFFKVRSTYYNLYVLESAIRITNENITFLETFKQLANVRLESNTGSAVDLLRVEMDLAELFNELEYLKDSREPIDAEFKELLNVDEIGVIQIPDTLSITSIANGKTPLIDSLLANNPSLRKFDSEIEALVSEAEVAKKMGYPSFNLGLSYTNITKREDVIDFPDNGKDAFIFPQIGVRVPLYRKKYKSMVLEKELLRSSKIQEKENRENVLLTELEKIWRDYLDAQRRVVLFQHLSTLAKQSLDILLTEYTSDGTDFEEMLRMDRKLLKYELELEKARADQNTSIAFITYLTAK
jgi:outer membrane protein TolC